MPATLPHREPLVGRYIRLDMLRPDDFSDLYRALGHPEVFAGGYGGGPEAYRDTREGFVSWAEGWFQPASRNIYGVYLEGGPNHGVLVGTSTLCDFDLENEHAHIGWTGFDPRVWGSAVNPEAKLLMLGHAFDHGFGRVKLQADVRNERSRAAIAKLGATFEGVVRRDVRRADGSWRDSAVYSVLIDEWPRVRLGLEERLAAFRGEPVALEVDSLHDN